MAIELRPAGREVLGLVDGPYSQGWADACAREGLQLIPYVEEHLVSGLPQLLLGPAQAWRLGKALSPPCHGFVECERGDSPMVSDLVLDALREGGLGLSVTTGTVFSLDVSARMAAAVASRFGIEGERAQEVELALYEAVGNAAIHGNLEVESDLRASVESLVLYRQTLADRLADPAFSRRRIEMTAARNAGKVIVCVEDQGKGYDLHAVLDRSAVQEAKSGRGLGLIRQLAAHVEAGKGGRRLTMVFETGVGS